MKFKFNFRPKEAAPAVQEGAVSPVPAVPGGKLPVGRIINGIDWYWLGRKGAQGLAYFVVMAALFVAMTLIGRALYGF